MIKRVLASLTVLALLGGTAPVDVRAAMSASQVEEALTCQCGCGLTVHSCNHLECSFAVPARKDIAESLARGESGEQIINRYKLKYGEKVLSSPLPEGFNLLAWIAPYAAIFLVGALMLVLFRRQIGKRAPGSRSEADDLPPYPDHSTPEMDERRTRLRKEVEELER